MLNKFFLLSIALTLFINYSSIKTYSAHPKEVPLVENTGDPATEEYRRDDKKKYIEEVQPKDNTKRYVGDEKKDNVENPKRRGTEKRYIGDEEDEKTFFIEEKKALGIEEPYNE